jgi:hypothetical protein
MSRARTPHDPLRGHNWRDGVEPAPEPIPAPQQEPEVDYSLNSKQRLMELKAVGIIRRLYNVRGPFDWSPALDRKARTVFNKLMAGEPIPDHWRTQYREPPPINPDQWLTPRQRSR